jgi:hypothetical protein
MKSSRALAFIRVHKVIVHFAGTPMQTHASIWAYLKGDVAQVSCPLPATGTFKFFRGMRVILVYLGTASSMVLAFEGAKSLAKGSSIITRTFAVIILAQTACQHALAVVLAVRVALT